MRATHVTAKAVLVVLFYLLSLIVLVAPAYAQTLPTPEEQFQRHMKVNEDITPLGENPFGEQVDLYTGALSFDQSDIVLHGDGPDIVIGRSIAQSSKVAGANPWYADFGDWRLDVPRITAIVTGDETATSVSGEWTVGPEASTNRCSQMSEGVYLNLQGSGLIPPDGWGQGLKLIVPGQGEQDVLVRANSQLRPTATGPGGAPISFNAFTNTHWMIGCLAQTKSGDPGEAFYVVSPDGTTYQMDWFRYTWSGGVPSPFSLPPAKPIIVLSVYAEALVTRVQDRFGNWVQYNYTGRQLTGIVASDGRNVTIGWRGDAPFVDHITVTDGAGASRTWSYAYTGVAQEAANGFLFDGHLSAVTLPDGSTWQFNLGSLLGATPGSDLDTGLAPFCQGGYFSPNFPNSTASGSITQPSGLTGTFTVGANFRTRVNRPRPAQACPAHPPSYFEPAEYWIESLTGRTYTGAGVNESWHYAYASSPVYWADQCPNGVCPSHTVTTDVTDPAGNITRYSFDNTIDSFMEGKLVSTQFGFNPSTGASLRQELRSYADPNTGGPFNNPIGIPLDGLVNVAQHGDLAPANLIQTLEEGDTYTWQAESFNAYGQVLQAKRSNSIAGQSSIDESTSYLNDTNLWTLGLTTQVVNNTDSQIESSNTYTSQDQLATRSQFGQQLMSYGYDVQGHLTSFTDGNGHATLLSAYKLGIPQSVTYPDGKSASLVVDGFEQIDSFTDQRGATASYQYDGVGRVTQVSHNSFSGDPAWLPQTYTYTFVTFAEEGLPAGHWRRSIDQGDAVKADWFDALMRPVLTDNGIKGSNGGVNISKVTGYDWQGKVTFASNPVNGIPDLTTITTGMHTQYDALERVVQIQQDSELGPLTTATAYLPGATRQVTDPKGNVTTLNYQVFGEPSYNAVTQVRAPEGVTQNVARDRYGKPTVITQGGSYNGQALSVSKTFVYDANQRLCRFTDPETNSTVYSYDGANNIAWQATGQVVSGAGCGQEQVADAVKTFHTYDPMNRVLTITPPTGTQSTAYTYDNVGELLDAQSGSNHWFTSYNSLGHEQGEAFQVDGQAAASGVGYTYDNYGHVLAANYFPGGGAAPEVVNYAPDALGRPTQAGSYATNIAYQLDGSLAGYTLGNGIRVTLSQNTRLLLSGKSAIGASNTALNELYAYDANGNLISVNDIGGNNNSQTEGYDALNRLTSGNAPSPWGAQTYAYDPLNNLRENVNNGTLVDYGLDGTSRMTSETVNGGPFQTFGYDARGNRTSEITRGVLTTYNFDALNQLLSIPGEASYLYDDLGRRVAKTLASGATSYFFYTRTNGHLLQQSDSLSGLTTNYIYLNNELIARHQGSAVTYTVTDRLGTPIVESNASGATTVRFAYDPYGGRRQGVNQQQPGFTGHLNDPENGLTYMQARYYDPNGHMTSPDPVYPVPGDLFGFNRYDYAKNNPLLNIDPDGKDPELAFFRYKYFISKLSQSFHDSVNDVVNAIDGRSSVEAKGTLALGGGGYASKGIYHTKDSVGIILVGQGGEAAIDYNFRLFSVSLPTKGQESGIKLHATFSLHAILGGNVQVEGDPNGTLSAYIGLGTGLGESTTLFDISKEFNSSEESGAENGEEIYDYNKIMRETSRQSPYGDPSESYGRFGVDPRIPSF